VLLRNVNAGLGIPNMFALFDEKIPNEAGVDASSLEGIFWGSTCTVGWWDISTAEPVGFGACKLQYAKRGCA
jgi:hypothetical protein